MADLLQIAGAQGAPSDFAPLHINRLVTGYWTNTNPLRDAATSMFIEKFYGGRQDRIAAGINSELSARLTLRRRPGVSVYNSQLFPAINRFYGWNTFTLTSEAVRVMADTATGGTNGSGIVYDATGPSTQTQVWQKAAGAGSTYFLGVGNILYMTNGKENLQLNNATGKVSNWGIPGPTTAPVATQAPRVSPYPVWQPSVCYGWPLVFDTTHYAEVVIVDTNNVLHVTQGGGVTGPGPNPPNFNPGGSTQDGTIEWNPVYNPTAWQAGYAYAAGQSYIVATVSGMPNTFRCISGSGNSAAQPPNWPASGQVQDGPFVWQNVGITMVWSNPAPNQPFIGPNRTISSTAIILDPNGYVQQIIQPGVSSTQPPNPWQEEPGAFTSDGTAAWVNTAPYSVGATAPVQYGYAYQNSATTDLSNMSPPSIQITVVEGNQITLTGDGSADPEVDTIPIYRTAQGGSTFLLLDTIPNPGGGKKWTYIDNKTDAQLNTEIQAQVSGEGTPLPVGATCLEYHLGRIFAAVGNVVYISSGPDAVASGSSGNAGFDTTFTLQSKITRFWVNSLGCVVFTLRDAYIILGSATQSDPLYVFKYIENIPLLNYDAFAIFLTTPYLLSGHGMVNALDPSSGIVEASFPIADQISAMSPKTSYVTFHSGGSGETALYVADGKNYWYRMAPTSAPESGLNWNPAAYITQGTSAVQSVEVLPGTFQLLIGPFAGTNPNSPATGPILMRDPTVNQDDGTSYASSADIGNIVLAHSGQLAGLAWLGVESEAEGTPTQVAVLLDEIAEVPGSESAKFYVVPRSRQDPPNMPPSESLYSNRHSLLQGQNPVWCKSLQLRFEWPPEDAANELLTFTVFGQTWAEQRSQ